MGRDKDKILMSSARWLADLDSIGARFANSKAEKIVEALK